MPTVLRRRVATIAAAIGHRVSCAISRSADVVLVVMRVRLGASNVERRGGKPVFRMVIVVTASFATYGAGAVVARAQGTSTSYQLAVSNLSTLPAIRDSRGRTIRPYDVALLSATELAVLDLRAGQLRVIELVATPPTVIREISVTTGLPRARLTGGGGAVALLDQAFGRLTVYHLRSHAASLPKSFSTGFGYADACLDGTRVAVVGLDEGKILHQFDVSGQRVLSSGEPWGLHPAEQVVAATMQGMVLCADNRFLVASSIRSPVKAYARDGRELWRFPIPNFDSVLALPAGKAVTFKRPQEAPDGILSLFAPASDVVGVQVARGRAATPAEQIETWFLDGTNGRVLGRQHGLPIIRDVVDGVLISFHPQLGTIQFATFQPIMRQQREE